MKREYEESPSLTLSCELRLPRPSYGPDSLVRGTFAKGASFKCVGIFPNTGLTCLRVGFYCWPKNPRLKGIQHPNESG